VRFAKLNSLQALVLGFLSLGWLSLIAILALAPDVYGQSCIWVSGIALQLNLYSSRRSPV